MSYNARNASGENPLWLKTTSEASNDLVSKYSFGELNIDHTAGALCDTVLQRRDANASPYKTYGPCELK